MKREELRKIIKEEIKNYLNEATQVFYHGTDDNLSDEIVAKQNPSENTVQLLDALYGIKGFKGGFFVHTDKNFAKKFGKNVYQATSETTPKQIGDGIYVIPNGQKVFLSKI
jgi:hypothetical protein